MPLFGPDFLSSEQGKGGKQRRMLFVTRGLLSSPASFLGWQPGAQNLKKNQTECTVFQVVDTYSSTKHCYLRFVPHYATKHADMYSVFAPEKTKTQSTKSSCAACSDNNMKNSNAVLTKEPTKYAATKKQQRTQQQQQRH